MKTPRDTMDSNATSRQVKKAGLFVGLTFLVNWSFALLFCVLGGRWGTPVGMAFGAAYMFVPMIVAILLQKKVCREPVKGPLGISFRLNRWFLVAWLLPPVIALVTFGVSLLLPGIEYSPQMQGLSIALIRGGSDLTTGVTGLPGFVVLAAVILILWLRDSKPAGADESIENMGIVQSGGLEPWNRSPSLS